MNIIRILYIFCKHRVNYHKYDTFDCSQERREVNDDPYRPHYGMDQFTLYRQLEIQTLRII